MRPSHLKPVMLVAALSGAVVACETPVMSPEPPDPSFAVVENSKVFIPVDFFLFGPCVSEPTQSRGRLHILIIETVTPSGRRHFRFQLNANGTGVGLTTGAKYQWNHAINEGFSVDENDGLPYTYTWVNRVRLIGQGQVPDRYYDFILHVTINANGEETVSKFEETFECR